MVISSLEEGEEIETPKGGKSLLDGILQTVLKECQLSVPVVFPEIPHQLVAFPNLLDQTMHFQGSPDELPSSLSSSVPRLSCLIKLTSFTAHVTGFSQICNMFYKY
jgi:hypothetical protein